MPTHPCPSRQMALSDVMNRTQYIASTIYDTASCAQTPCCHAQTLLTPYLNPFWQQHIDERDSLATFCCCRKSLITPTGTVRFCVLVSFSQKPVHAVLEHHLSNSTGAFILDFIVAKVYLHQPLVGVLLQGLTDEASACSPSPSSHGCQTEDALQAAAIFPTAACQWM